MARNYSNVAVAATIENAGGLSTGTTTLVLSSTTGMPAVPFTLRARPQTANEELITVTGGLGSVGTPYTILRGVDGTSAKSHPQGSAIVHSISARDFKEPQDHIDNITPGGPHGLPTSAWQSQLVIAKAVEQSYNNDITYNDDNELKFSGLANTKYRVELNMMASGDQGNIQVIWSVPTGATGLRMCLGPPLASTNPNNTLMRSTCQPFSTDVGYGLTGVGITVAIQEKAIVSFGANAGICVIRHSQNTSHATPTAVKAGSYLIVTKLI
jgi:hypothetical protein